MRYSVRELKRSLLESASEFDPKFGNDLTYGKLNSTFQIKADSQKNANPVSADRSERMGNQKGRVSLDSNDTYYDGRDDYERLQRSISNYLDIEGADDAYNERMLAGFEGYITPEEKKAREAEQDENGAIPYSNRQYTKSSKDWAKHQTDAKKKNDERKQIAKGYSLSKKNAKDNVGKSEVKESVNTVPTLTFKHTKFQTQGHAESLIPESFKVDGKQFMMRDMDKNTYLFEWAGGPQVLRHEHKEQFDNHIDKMKRLWEHKDTYNDTSTTSNRITEDSHFRNMMNVMRGFKRKD